MITLLITSQAFDNNSKIPKRYTCDGDDINPPLEIKGIPKEAKSLVLIVDDPDAPRGTWEHWNVWNIPIKNKIEENTIPGIEGINDFGKHSYRGPCPPYGVHRYFFKIYALDKKLSIHVHSRKKEVAKAMSNHIIAKGELIGLYSR